MSASAHHLPIVAASTYAMIFTSFPRAPASISRTNSSARSSIEADGGTVAVITLTPCAVNASLIPRQYCTPGKYRPASRSSSKPSKPWARTTGCFGVSVAQSNPLASAQCDSRGSCSLRTVVISDYRVLVVDDPAMVLQARLEDGSRALLGRVICSEGEMSGILPNGAPG
jgi:hypothetical protein